MPYVAIRAKRLRDKCVVFSRSRVFGRRRKGGTLLYKVVGFSSLKKQGKSVGLKVSQWQEHLSCLGDVRFSFTTLINNDGWREIIGLTWMSESAGVVHICKRVGPNARRPTTCPIQSRRNFTHSRPRRKFPQYIVLLRRKSLLRCFSWAWDILYSLINTHFPSSLCNQPIQVLL